MLYTINIYRSKRNKKDNSRGKNKINKISY